MTNRADDKTGALEHPGDGAEGRREALARMGRFAGYTAPAMLALLGATEARAQVMGSSSGGGSSGGGYERKRTRRRRRH